MAVIFRARGRGDGLPDGAEEDPVFAAPCSLSVENTMRSPFILPFLLIFIRTIVYILLESLGKSWKIAICNFETYISCLTQMRVFGNFHQ